MSGEIEAGQTAPSWQRLWLLYALFSAATQLTDGVAQALLLSRSGLELLPPVFASKAVLALVLGAAYLPLAAWLGMKRTQTAILAFVTLGTAVCYALVLQRWALAYPLLYLYSDAVQTIFKIHWGVVLLASLPAPLEQLPRVYSGARAGGLVGGLLLLLSGPLGITPLLLLATGLYAATLVYWLTGSAPDAAPSPSRSDVAAPSSHDAPLWRSSLLAAIAVATLALVATRYALRYLYSATLAATFDEKRLAAAFGIFVAVASVVTGLLQAFVTPRLLAGAGLTTANLAFAVVVPLAFVAYRFGPALAAAAIARLVESELKAAIKTPISNLLYGGLVPAQRPAARAFVFGAVVPVGTAIAAVLLGVLPEQTLSWGSAAALLLFAATLLQNRSYRRAFAALGPRGSVSAEEAVSPTTEP